MRLFLLSLMTVWGVMVGYSMDGGHEPMMAAASSDTVSVMTLDQIIEQESKTQSDNKYVDDLLSAWKRNMYLNLIYNVSHEMSSKEFPSASGPFSNEFKSKWGLGLEWGKTFNFHRNPLGSVLFIGLDYTWMDLKFNKFEKSVAPVDYSIGVNGYNMPWHYEKMSFGYGMSLGPSLTVYPFTSIRNSANQIRLHLYFHVGYGIEGTVIKDAIVNGSDVKNGFAYGHGLYTSFGGNLSWKSIGVGYEMRNDGNLKYKVTDTNYDTGSLKIKEKTGRLYLQFRF